MNWKHVSQIGCIFAILITWTIMAGINGVQPQWTTVVTFPDPNLEAVIRYEINKPSGDILFYDLVWLFILYDGDGGISNISGLEYCTNLTLLYLPWDEISDITPLAGLTNLTWLYLYTNQISDITPLLGLTKLTQLFLNYNQISDITLLSGLTKLTGLDLSGNQISDITLLSGLRNLTVLFLDYNQISDITLLSGMTKLTRLRLHSNQISDIYPLVQNSGIGSGDEVDLTDNPLDDTSCTVYIPELESRGVTVYHTCP